MNYERMIISYVSDELGNDDISALESVMDHLSPESLADAIHGAYDICCDEYELGSIVYDSQIHVSDDFEQSVVSQNLCTALGKLMHRYLVVNVVGEIHESPKYREMAYGLEDYIDNRPPESTNFFDFDDGDHDFYIYLVTDYLELALDALKTDFCQKMKGFGNSEYYAFGLSGVYDLKADDWLKVNSIGDLHGNN